MSNAVATDAFLEAIRAAIVTAWGPITVDYGIPRLPVSEGAPLAVVIPESVQMEFSGLGSTNSVQQSNTFTIIGRFPDPSDHSANIVLEKITKVNALIAKLQAGTNFTSYGYLPLVRSVDFAEQDDSGEGMYEVELTFSVMSEADHH
jgi:hypothetical protein